MSNKVIIAGASGLIGSILMNILLQQPGYDEVLILVRKKLLVEHEKLVQLVTDFDQLDKHASAITGHAVFCSLGSTQKKTPDLVTYRKIDHDYPVELARIAKLNGIKQYHLVSSLGANSKSFNFYLKIKADTEIDIEKIGIKCLHIYEPSLLTGQRDEYRPKEYISAALMNIIDPLLVGGLRKYRSIPAETVARAMFNQSFKKEEGVFVHTSDKIKSLA